ncbi:hypothetical protein E4Z66_09735 [Aliishimia ponticola]|uniref:Uncharacterized protein n=2 Tax=Aliishimia ponticola TaxID=2499833 RepID=A0A4S4NEK7_9RHOB|nr:hypothetical protein E4Z66_09735 [Aliishimia ponticola]
MLAQKAARGGGAYPAQAAHFGRAFVRHVAAGRPLAPVLAALEALPLGPIQTLPFAPDGSALGQSYAEACAAPGEGPILPPRLTCPADVHARLTALAQRILVPQSAASRQAGAGAGLTDND